MLTECTTTDKRIVDILQLLRIRLKYETKTTQCFVALLLLPESMTENPQMYVSSNYIWFFEQVNTRLIKGWKVSKSLKG